MSLKLLVWERILPATLGDLCLIHLPADLAETRKRNQASNTYVHRECT